MQTQIIGRVRKLLEGIDGSAVSENEQITLTPQLELIVAQGPSTYQETVRMGRAFVVINTTAVAAVVAPPTTAVNMAIYNNAPDGGRSLVIDSVGAINIVSTAIASQAQMLICTGQLRETAPTDAALAIKKRNGLGGGTADSVVRTIIGGTALPATTGIVANWMPVGPSVTKTGVGATPGYGPWVALDGRYIVPPGRYFATQVMAPAIGETFITVISWHELQLNLA